jgi:hypothetical protein
MKIVVIFGIIPNLKEEIMNFYHILRDIRQAE